MINGHLEKLNETHCVQKHWSMLYRVFYYDAHPYQDQALRPISKKNINYRETPEAKLREELFREIRRKRSFALRLGNVYRENGWHLSEDKLKKLLAEEITAADLNDDDFSLGLRQKGVDMRLGMDITSLALKRQVDKLVLVSADTDFISVAKLARREGVEFILDPMWWNVNEDLQEHVDGVWSGLPKVSWDNNTQ